MGIITITFLFLVTAVTPVYLYPNGAPNSVAVLQVPHHGSHNPQTSPSPYVIQVSSTTYSPGDVITVTLEGNAGQEFSGFQLRALLVGGNPEEFPGDFIEYPSNTRAFFFYPTVQETSPKGYVTHTDDEDKIEVSVKWQAPPQSVGQIIFQAAVVEEYETFWVNIKSEVINPIVTPETLYSKYTVSDLSTFSLDTDCGVTKGCILYPKGCKGVDCSYGIGYKMDDTKQFISFEMFGKAKGYIALGLSEDNRMGGESTVTCAIGPNEAHVFYGVNPAGVLYNDRAKLAPTRLTNLAVSSDADKVYCMFNRSVIDEVYASIHNSYTFNHYTFDFTKPTYVFLAFGEMYTNTAEPRAHGPLPLITKTQVDLSKAELHYAIQINDYLKAHSSLGITAWLLLVPIAVFIARHFKTQLNKVICGAINKCHAKLWFHVHRSIMLLVVFLNVILVIVIFSYVKAWSESATIHAIFGLIAIVLSFVNVIGALLRPDPVSANRPIFNLAHRIGGISSLLFAVITILLGANVNLLASPLQKSLTLIIALWVAAMALWEVVMVVIDCVARRNKGADIMPDGKQPFPYKVLLFVFYLLLSLAFYIAFIYTIAVA